MLEIDETFSTLSEWLAFAAKNPAVYRSEEAARVGRRILENGFTEPHTHRHVAGATVDVPSGNWREELVHQGLNSRIRAVLALIAEAVADRPPAEVSIYAPEAITAFAAAARAVWPRYIGSEYLPTAEDRTRLAGVMHQDLSALTFADDSFDVIATNEVLEHVPNLDGSLSEIHRVLKPGGWHIGTHPFHFMSEESQVRARIENARIVHLMPPERHGNPTDPDGGSLVFQTPGWQILNQCRDVGFREPAMRFYASERHGCLTENLGVFVLCAQKPLA